MLAGIVISPAGDPRWRTPWRTAAHGEDLQRSSLQRTESCGRHSILQHGKSARSPSHEEGEAVTRYDELTSAPIPCPPVPLGGRETGNAVESGEKSCVIN